MGFRTKNNLDHVGGSVLLDTVLGETTDAKGNPTLATVGRIYGPGQELQGDLAPHLKDSFEESEYLRSILDETDEDGNVTGVSEDDAEAAQAQAQALEDQLSEKDKEIAELQNRLAELESSDDGSGESESGGQGGGDEAYDPGEYKVDEVVSYLEDANEDERKRVIVAEKKGKGRATILNWKPEEA